ncbi:PAX3- and PAX7-binding protein 1 [Brevipalpus obovatus]|uniref:PAX3- and PAX7-binding protein 1 n=1 Tax=Brevipalpus obovatus TaxID=246614 RepID=UPI003D9F6C5E
MSLFKKPNRQFRSRVVRVDSEGEDDKAPGDQVKVFTNQTAEEVDEKPVPKASKPSVKLSFDDEEEETSVFKVKKSANSKRISKQMKKEQKKREKETRLGKGNSDDQSQSDKNFSMINEESKAIRDEEDEPLSFSVPELDEDEPVSMANRAGSSSETIPIHQFKKVLLGKEIPDCNTIYAMKRQRQMARNIDETIELVTGNDDGRAHSGIEDDADIASDEGMEDDDEDEDDHRIDFAVDKEALERVRAEESFIVAQEEREKAALRDDCDSEDEFDRWEQEQIRKGVGLPSASHILNDLGQNSSKIKNSSDESVYKTRSSSKIPNFLLKNREVPSKKEILKELNDFIVLTKLSVEADERKLNLITEELNRNLVTLEILKSERKEKEKFVGNADIS